MLGSEVREIRGGREGIAGSHRAQWRLRLLIGVRQEPWKVLSRGEVT